MAHPYLVGCGELSDRVYRRLHGLRWQVTAVALASVLLLAGCENVNYTVVRPSNNGIAEFQKAHEVYLVSRAKDERGIAHEKSMRDVDRLLRAAIDNDPDCVLFHSRRGELLLELEPEGDNYSVAVRELDESLRLCEDWVPAHIGHAIRLTRLASRSAGNFQEAEGHLADAEHSLQRLMDFKKTVERGSRGMGFGGGLELIGGNNPSSSRGPELKNEEKLKLLLGWLLHNELWQCENTLIMPGQPGSPLSAGLVVDFLERRLHARIEYQRAEIMIVAGEPADKVIERLELALKWDPNFNTARIELAVQVRKGGNLQAQESLLHPFMQPGAPAHIRNNGRIRYELATLYADMYYANGSMDAFNTADAYLHELVEKINKQHSAGLVAYANLLYRSGSSNGLRSHLDDALGYQERAQNAEPGLRGCAQLRQNILAALEKTR